jgi:hypothetical protein
MEMGRHDDLKKFTEDFADTTRLMFSKQIEEFNKTELGFQQQITRLLEGFESLYPAMDNAN